MGRGWCLGRDGTAAGHAAVLLLLQAGTADRILPYEENALPSFEAMAPPTLMATYWDAGHFTFSDLCVLELGAVQALIYDSVGNVMQDGCGPDNPDPDLALPLVRFHAVALINGMLRASPGSLDWLGQGTGQPEHTEMFTMQGEL